MLHGAPLLGSRGVSGRLVCFFWWVLDELEHTRCELGYTSKWLVKRLLPLHASNCGHVRPFSFARFSFALGFSFFSGSIVTVKLSIEHLSKMLVYECTPLDGGSAEALLHRNP